MIRFATRIAIGDLFLEVNYLKFIDCDQLLRRIDKMDTLLNLIFRKYIFLRVVQNYFV